jgi:type IV secretory pathway VirB10-like protein
MFSKPFAVGLLIATCVTAAAGGAYVAVRQNQAEAKPATAAERPVGSATAPDASATPAVRETEAVVAPPPAPAPEPALEQPSRKPSAATASVRTERAERPRPAPPPVANRMPAASRPASTAPEPAAAANSHAPTPLDPAPTSGRSESPVTADVPPEAPRPEPAPAVPTRIFDELVVPASSVIGLQIETPVSSERARVEDRVEARVMRDVPIDGRTAIPAGARAIGAVTLVERGGKVKERARLGVRFHTLVLADGTELQMRTDPILREGESPTGESARKIGGAAVGGAILGALIGGKKGAVIGGATGAAGGSAVVMAGDRNAATLPVGAVVTVRLSAPMTVEVERR